MLTNSTTFFLANLWISFSTVIPINVLWSSWILPIITYQSLGCPQPAPKGKSLVMKASIASFTLRSRLKHFSYRLHFIATSRKKKNLRFLELSRFHPNFFCWFHRDCRQKRIVAPNKPPKGARTVISGDNPIIPPTCSSAWVTK